MNLYDVNANYRLAEERLFATVDEFGELDPEALIAYQQAIADRDEMIENVILAIKEDTAMIEAIEKEIKSLTERKKIIQNRNEWREGYLTNVLDGEKFETARGRASFRKSDKVNVIDPKAIPEEFLKVKTETLPDKTAIKNALKAGRAVEGCELETRLNIQIK